MTEKLMNEHIQSLVVRGTPGLDHCSPRKYAIDQNLTPVVMDLRHKNLTMGEAKRIIRELNKNFSEFGYPPVTDKEFQEITSGK